MYRSIYLFFCRYMARRCEFLEKFVGLRFNGGVGSGLGKNSVLLGSTVVEVMIREVVNMSENFDYRRDRKKIQQVTILSWLIIYNPLLHSSCPVEIYEVEGCLFVLCVPH